MDYKYKTTFECPISVCEISKAPLISEASLSNLAPLVPKNIDYKSNVDLLGVAFNAAVVNKFNRNGDGMSTSTAIEHTPNFIHKPTNIEHDKEKIVGHIASAGFSEYGTNKIIGEESIKNLKKPFNIALGAVVAVVPVLVMASKSPVASVPIKTGGNNAFVEELLVL